MKPVDPSTNILMKNLQGNILKGHGRDNSNQLFIEFLPDKDREAKAWLADFSKKQVTSAQVQYEQIMAYRLSGEDGGVFASVFFTKKGYKTFGYDNVCEKFKSRSFLNGLKVPDQRLNDPPVNEWEEGFRMEIDVMILLAANDFELLEQITASKVKELMAFAKVHIERGRKLTNHDNQNIEHFGYVDGISNPIFFKDEIDAYQQNKPINYDPSADTNLVLVRDPYMNSSMEEPCMGSFLVYRKLHQDVKGFKLAEKELGEKLFPNSSAHVREIVGAYIIGRFENGSPVTESQYDDVPDAHLYNNFNYKNDTGGQKCPYFAHIRKMNPREDLDGTDHKSHVMARRGMPYGKEGEVDVGLLFMSFQADIENQFEHIQINWANDSLSPKQAPANATGVDIIIGQPVKYRFPEYGTSNSKQFALQQFVTFKGGEYFFAPSIPFLTYLNTIV